MNLHNCVIILWGAGVNGDGERGGRNRGLNGTRFGVVIELRR